jgi:hypothetical protein
MAGFDLEVTGFDADGSDVLAEDGSASTAPTATTDDKLQEKRVPQQ